jgi:hypothetical protein
LRETWAATEVTAMVLAAEEPAAEGPAPAAYSDVFSLV